MRSPPPPYEEGAFGPDAEDEAEVFSEKHAMLNKVEDIEAAHIPPSPTVSEAASGKHAAEYRVAPRTKYMYLGVYFGLNLALTLFNKAILGRVSTPDSECSACQMMQADLCSGSLLSLGFSPPYTLPQLR